MNSGSGNSASLPALRKAAGRYKPFYEKHPTLNLHIEIFLYK
jgi:hypothetical protein